MVKFDIVCFGSALIDIFAETDVHEKGKMIAYPIGAKLQIKDLEFSIGGGGINTSTTFSRFGMKTGFLSKIGNEDLSKKIFDKLKKEKVKFLGKNKGRVGYSIILDSKEHDRTILTFKGDNDHLSWKEIAKIDTKWLYFSSLMHESFQSQLKLAKSEKYNIAFNPSLYLFGKEDVNELIKYVKILVLNNEEADMVCKEHKKILELGPEIVCVTDGKNPFYFYTKEKTYKVYPHTSVKVVEKTGAGDAFASGFVASYVKTKDIKKSIQVGVANSEAVVTSRGSTNNILTWKEALKEIKENGCKVEEVL